MSFLDRLYRADRGPGKVDMAIVWPRDIAVKNVLSVERDRSATEIGVVLNVNQGCVRLS